MGLAPGLLSAGDDSLASDEYTSDFYRDGVSTFANNAGLVIPDIRFRTTVHTGAVTLTSGPMAWMKTLIEKLNLKQ